jgi:CRP/FNR family cyclic AMP-dependent transcriptional regulator
VETLAPILSAHPFFKGFAPEHLKLLTGCASNVRFDAGQVIFREGEDAKQFFIIRGGKVALEIVPPIRSPVVIQTVGRGEILGWSWLFPPHYWKFNARVVEPSIAIAIDGECLRNKCDSDPAFGYVMMKRFASIMQERLHALTVQLLDVYGK